MDNDVKPSLIERAQADLDRVEAYIDDLNGKIVALQANLEKHLASRQRLTNALEVMRSYSEAPALQSDVKNTSKDLPALEKSHPMYGKGWAEAAVFLIKAAKRPLTGKEIVKRMQDLGVVFTMPDPVMNANLSLNRRKDVVTRLQGGRWSIKEPGLEAEENAVDTGCVKRVSDKDHYEKTLAGLAAARARGVFGGRKPVMVNGRDEKARELLKQGISPMKVAQEIGISRSAIYRFMEDNNIERKKYSRTPKGSEGV